MGPSWEGVQQEVGFVWVLSSLKGVVIYNSIKANGHALLAKSGEKRGVRGKREL